LRKLRTKGFPAGARSRQRFKGKEKIRVRESTKGGRRGKKFQTSTKQGGGGVRYLRAIHFGASREKESLKGGGETPRVFKGEGSSSPLFAQMAS